MAWWTVPFATHRPIHLLLVEAVSTQCPTTMNSIVGLKDKSVGHFFRNAVRDNRNRVYIEIDLRCCHFEMSASTAVSPPKEQSWLDERRWGSGSKKTNNIFLVLLLKGKREALLLRRKRTVSAKVSRLSRALAKLDSHSEALRVSEALRSPMCYNAEPRTLRLIYRSSQLSSERISSLVIAQSIDRKPYDGKLPR